MVAEDPPFQRPGLEAAPAVAVLEELALEARQRAVSLEGPAAVAVGAWPAGELAQPRSAGERTAIDRTPPKHRGSIDHRIGSDAMRVMLLDDKRHENAESGYGQLAAGIKSEFERRGTEIELDARREADVALYVCPPYSILDRTFSFPAAIFTMHEVDHLPEGKKDWPERLNTTDLVITPTSWNRAVWKRLGVTTPIEIAPLGIDETAFFPRWAPTCRFLTVHNGLGSDSSRENWRDTLEAYMAAFSAKDDVELVVKTWSWHEPPFRRALAEVCAKHGHDAQTGPPVTVIDERLSAADMRELYMSAWLFIKNANREGWSLPCSEAVACDLRVASTEIQPMLSHLPPDTVWFTPGDAAELRFLMRQERRQHAARLARAHKHTWRNTGAWVHRYLTELVARESASPPTPA